MPYDILKYLETTSRKLYGPPTDAFINVFLTDLSYFAHLNL